NHPLSKRRRKRASRHSPEHDTVPVEIETPQVAQLPCEPLLHVVVCGKVIPDSSVTLQIDPATKRMLRKDLPHELDPAAASAVEEALRLTEKHGGSVTFVTMGIPDATIGIRRALAIGATAGVHLLDDAFAGSDTLGTAKALAAAIKQLPAFDLV